MSTFSERLKIARKEKSVTMKELSQALSIPLTTYANYEQGKREPPLWLLAKLCDYFDVSADYLIGRTDDY